MRFTRRLLDHPLSVFLIAACSLPSLLVTSCSSDDETGATLPIDKSDAASSDVSADPADAAADAHAEHNVPPFDGGPLPVVCTSQPCATSLVTAIGSGGPLPGGAFRAIGRGISSKGVSSTEAFCAMLSDGTVACWGDNTTGELGRRDVVTNPTGITQDPDTIASGRPLRVEGLSSVVELAHTCARTENGDVWCWGPGPYFDGDAGVYRPHEGTPAKMAIPPATHIASSDSVRCAVTNDGLVCWGENANKQIDPNSSGQRLPEHIDLPAGAAIRQLAVSQASIVIREDGSTLSWGQILTVARVTSLNPDPYPAPTVLDKVSSIDLTHDSACATSEGIGYCWGLVDLDRYAENQYLLIPFDPSVSALPSPLVHALPEPVVAPEPLVQIATTENTLRGGYDNAQFKVDEVRPQRWCAVGASGAVYCWGLNTSGQAGDGMTNNVFNAVKVNGLPAPAVEVRTMPTSTCALLTTGKIYCWGDNSYGQLGNGHVGGGSVTPQEVVLP